MPLNKWLTCLLTSGCCLLEWRLMGAGKGKQWEALPFACLSLCRLNWCILQFLKQQHNSHKMHAVRKGWWGSGLFSFWSEMEHYLAQEYAEHYAVCLTGGKHPFLPKASLDLGIHFSIWVNIFFVSYLIKTSNKKRWEIRSLQAEQLLILLAKGHKQGEVPADAWTSTLTWVQNTDKKKPWQDEIPKEYLILLLFVSVQSKVRKPLMSAELDVLLTRELVTWQEITKGWL